MISVVAQAAVVQSLYSVQMPIASRDARVREKALPTAFQSVLVKVSGNSAITSGDQISDAMPNVDKYMREFGYSEIQSSTANSTLMLNVSFLKSAVNDLLRQASQPIWSKNRPLTLVWLAVQNQNGPVLVGDDASNQVVQLLQQDAANRGMPLVFPMLDLTDMQAVKAADVWAPMLTTVQDASKRYAPDDILIIRLNIADPKNITGQWTLLVNGEQERWESDGQTLESVVQAGVNSTADALGKRFSVQANVVAENTISLTVTGLQSVNDYAKVMNYLSGLTGVANIEVNSVSSSQAVFNVTFTSGVDALQREIGLNSTLQSVQQTDVMDADQQQGSLLYQYNEAGQ